MKKTCKGVIFDFNGTLFNDTRFHNEAWTTFAANYNYDLTEEDLDKHIHGFTNREIFEYLFKRKLNENELGIYYEEKEEIYREICREHPQKSVLTRGAENFLNHLKLLEVPRTIATASYLKNVNLYFEIFKLDRWFGIENVIYDSGEFRGKPHPDMFLAAMDKLDLPAPACMIIEDSKGGITAAKNAGAGIIIAADFEGKPDKFAQFDFIDQIITDFNELISWFN